MNFPDEILALIVSFLDPNDFSTLAALRRTGRAFNRVASPLIYKIVKVVISSSVNRVEPRRQIWDLVEHPALPPLVKELHVGTKPPGAPSRRIWDMAKDPNSWSLASLHFLDLSADVASKILSEAQQGSGPACVALLLALCHDLEVLQFDCSYGTMGSQTKLILDHASNHYKHVREGIASSPVNADILKSVRKIHMGDGIYQTPLKVVLDLLYLPQLHSLRVYGMSNNRDFNDDTLPPPDNLIRNDNPIEIILDACMLNGEGIGRLLAACSCPKSLIYRRRLGLWCRDRPPYGVGDAIRRHGLTLETIHVNVIDDRLANAGVAPGRLGSLADTKAKTLVIPVDGQSASDDSFSAYDLPPTLEELYLLGVGGFQTKAYNNLYGNAAVPNLKKIVGVPWKRYSILEWFGSMSHECIDYDSVGGLTFCTTGR